MRTDKEPKADTEMKWTDPKPPTEGVSYYNHVICQTPLGKYMIEWKAWKENGDYGIDLNGEYIGTAYSLDEAKKMAQDYLFGKHDELKKFLNL